MDLLFLSKTTTAFLLKKYTLFVDITSHREIKTILKKYNTYY